ncbi:MAG: UDP-N-acetylmuramoyl-tripeptide--D-alanyl-D-alanine ligase, partial [Bryobacteraceae bacterium]
LLVGVRGDARQMLAGAIEAGLPPAKTAYFDDPAEAGAFVKEYAREGDALLLKGSRGVRMERALEAFLN